MQEIHAAAIAAGWEGKKMPRPEMEAYLARELGLSVASIKIYVKTGTVLQLWQPIDQRPSPGALLILPPPKVAEEEGGAVAVDA